MLLFDFLVPRLGLVPALVALFFTAALGGREFRFGEVLALTAVMHEPRAVRIGRRPSTATADRGRAAVRGYRQ